MNLELGAKYHAHTRHRAVILKALSKGSDLVFGKVQVGLDYASKVGCEGHTRHFAAGAELFWVLFLEMDLTNPPTAVGRI